MREQPIHSNYFLLFRRKSNLENLLCHLHGNTAFKIQVCAYKYQLCNKDLTKRLSLAPSVIFVIKANSATSLLAY